MINEFKEKLSTIYSPQDTQTALEGLNIEKRNVSFRVNTLKATNTEVQKALQENNIEFTQVPYYSDMYIIEEKNESILWELEIYTSGKVYIQSIASQLPVHVFEKNDKHITILDATAAPGGKTSQLSALFPKSVIYAFEKSKIRCEKLIHNLKKLGVRNTQVVHSDVSDIKNNVPNDTKFDKILIDAPCSGEGRFNFSNPKTTNHYIQGINKRNYKIQQSIVDSVIPYLAENGELIYSTCTISPEENEAIVHYILCHYPELSLVNSYDEITSHINSDEYISVRPGLKQYGKHHYKASSTQTIRVLPTQYCEGFYIAKFKKTQK